MVRSGDVVAERLGRGRRRRTPRPRCGSREQRSGSAHHAAPGARARARSRVATASLEARDTTSGAVAVERVARDLARGGSDSSCASISACDRARERARGREQHDAASGVVLGLRQHVGGDEGRVGGAVGDDEHLARPGDRVDVDVAVDEALRGATQTLPGPTILSTRGIVSVP